MTGENAQTTDNSTWSLPLAGLTNNPNLILPLANARRHKSLGIHGAPHPQDRTHANLTPLPPRAWRGGKEPNHYCSGVLASSKCDTSATPKPTPLTVPISTHPKVPGAFAMSPSLWPSPKPPSSPASPALMHTSQPPMDTSSPKGPPKGQKSQGKSYQVSASSTAMAGMGQSMSTEDIF